MVETKITAQTLAFNFVESLDGLKFVFVPGGGWYSFHDKTGWGLVVDWVVKAKINKKCWNIVQGSENLTSTKLNDVFQLVKTALTVPDVKKEGLDPALWIRFSEGEIVAESAAGWIACNNALLDVEKVASALYERKPVPVEAVKPLSPELFVLGRVPCDFEPGSACPRWLQFINEVCSSNVDRINLQRLFGLSLTYNRKYNVFFVVYGEAGTGKSTCLSVLEKLNSGAVCSVALSDFGERFYAYPLTENRLNLVADMPSVWESASTAVKREAVLKSLTDGEINSVERKGENAVTRRLVALSVFGSNMVPRFADKSGAIRQRLRLLPFPFQFRGKPGQNPNLKKELLSELPGVFVWALTGYGELLSEGYKTFPESEEAEILKHEAELKSNPVLQFCEECLEKAAPDSAVSSINVYRAYNSFCIQNGLRAAGSSSVIPEICSIMRIGKPVPYGKTRRKTFLGIRLAIDSEEAESGNSYSNYQDVKE